jgi:hypothetical protein
METKKKWTIKYCHRSLDDSVIIDGKRLTAEEFKKLQLLYPEDSTVWVIFAELKDEEILNPRFDKAAYRKMEQELQNDLLTKNIQHPWRHKEEF